MNCEHFIKFSKYFGAFTYNAIYHPETLLGKGQVNPDFYADINRCLPQSKVFEISDEIKKLLSLTDTPIKNDEIKLPFPFIFLDMQFTKEELAELGIEIEAKKIIGVLVREGVLYKGEEEYGKDLRFSIMLEGINEQEKEDVWFVTFHRNFNLDKDLEQLKIMHIRLPHSDKKSEDFIYKFFLNFLNFLHNPDIEYIEVSRSQKNIERRAREGKPIIPASYIISLTGKLKEYMDRLQSGGQFHFNFRFWVRGHFRTLQAERWKEKRGIRIWIPPFIKGDGILVDKSYQLKESKANNFADEKGDSKK
jgi:hypothetical protein